ncbi:serine hydrolase domain-containing protein [Jannaschia formosa]|uniref:serine hydrolase domain-containing protein n=1 Tax=Jannaschia formosa TaxID=2259592 RepID=UPI002475018F|nr:serine hydrolase domain-containing protein [Jannaschia formosa]
MHDRRRGDLRVWPWWSVTKTAIACAVLRLARRGAVELDAPLPGYGHSLRTLLRHEARLPCYSALPAYRAAVAAGEAAWPADDLIARCASLPRPDGWAYSNLGYLLARRTLEEATGLPLAELLRREVLAPLSLSARLAEGCEALPMTPGYDFGWVYHGCLIGPAAEAAAMMRGILGGALLEPSELAQMTRPTLLGDALPGRPWTRHGYGLGLMIGEMRGRPAAGHSGGGPGATCAVFRVGGTVVAAFATDARPGVTERAVVRAAPTPDRG